jgi:hypothetical protein
MHVLRQLRGKSMPWHLPELRRRFRFPTNSSSRHAGEASGFNKTGAEVDGV